MLILRTYALYASDRRILRGLGVIALTVVAVACVSFWVCQFHEPSVKQLCSTVVYPYGAQEPIRIALSGL
jgi:hypothetical protein